MAARLLSPPCDRFLFVCSGIGHLEWAFRANHASLLEMLIKHGGDITKLVSFSGAARSLMISVCVATQSIRDNMWFERQSEPAVLEVLARHVDPKLWLAPQPTWVRLLPASRESLTVLAD